MICPEQLAVASYSISWLKLKWNGNFDLRRISKARPPLFISGAFHELADTFALGMEATKKRCNLCTFLYEVSVFLLASLQSERCEVGEISPSDVRSDGHYLRKQPPAWQTNRLMCHCPRWIPGIWIYNVAHFQWISRSGFTLTRNRGGRYRGGRTFYCCFMLFK